MSKPFEIMDPFEECPHRTGREILRRQGYEPLPPDQIDHFRLRGGVWEFIYAMAARRFYLTDTDHLTDRQLYRWLHDVWLEEVTCDILPVAEWNSHVSPSEPSDGPEDEAIWLRYCAADWMREKWAIDFPECKVPPHEDPPFDRDQWLPDAPMPRQPMEFEEGDDFSLDEDFTRASFDKDPDPLGLNQSDEPPAEE